MKNNELKETPHIKPNGVEIAETILLPGDPQFFREPCTF